MSHKPVVSQRRAMPKFHVKKGDTVVVLSGSQKGKEGKVLYIDTKKGTAIVESVNIITKHRKANRQNQQAGEILNYEAPIRLCKLMLLDPTTGERTRTGRRLENGKLVRYSKKTQAIV